ncbi:MAG: NAD(+)/NADH kinase [Bacteroidales bacterium]|nr:NAD(+)/NADH kinase [Bacteroidales bacterium]
MKIAILGRAPEGRFLENAATLLETASKRGATLCYCTEFLEAFRKYAIPVPPGDSFDARGPLPKDTDILLTLGGDGTFLSSLVCVRDSGIPVAGINFGRLGFLTAAEAGAGNGAIEALFSGRYSVCDRALLSLTEASAPLPQDFYPFAINEVTFSGEPRGLVSIRLKIDDRQLPPFWADGLIVSTPTGSTAYSLSLGGPIVLPDSEVAVITPIASHNLNVRPMVVPLSSRLEVTVSSHRGGVLLTADERTARFSSGFRACLTRGTFPLRTISFSDSNFIDALRTKLHWGEDVRNNHTL